MIRFWQTVLILFILVAVAVPLRWTNLSQRPFHADESVQAMKFRTLWNTGVYKYDPNEFHGPTLPYFSLPIHFISGAEIDTEKESVLRSVPSCYSLLGILFLLLFRVPLGTSGLIASALLLSITPSLLFYNRYYIHETLLFIFTLFFIGTIWKYSQTAQKKWIILSGVAMGLMFATKETFVFNIAAAVGSAIILLAFEKKDGKVTLFLKKIPLSHWFLGLSGFIAIWLILFSSFFSNIAGLLDSFKTYLPWLNRAGGSSPHIWPWYYYLERYFWFSKDGGPIFTELVILLPAALGIWSGFKENTPPTLRRFSCFLAGYTLLLALIYCIIPYKTPWCFINVILGLILLAGLGTRYICVCWHSIAAKTITLLILLAGGIHLVYQDNLLNNTYFEESKNPHIYAHSISDIRYLAKTVEKLRSIYPDPQTMTIQVIAQNGDYWPLPWYLRQSDEKTGWYNTPPEKIFAPVVIYSPKFYSTLKEQFGSSYQSAGIYGFRPNLFFQLSVDKTLWKEYVDKGLAAEEDED